MIDPTVKRENVFLKLGKLSGFDKPIAPKDPAPADPGVTTKMPQVVRTMDDPAAAAEAMRIYNPTLPPMTPSPAKPLSPVQPEIKAPSKPMLNQGTADTLSTSGRWGNPEGAK